MCLRSTYKYILVDKVSVWIDVKEHLEKSSACSKGWHKPTAIAAALDNVV